MAGFGKVEQSSDDEYIPNKKNSFWEFALLHITVENWIEIH